MDVKKKPFLKILTSSITILSLQGLASVLILFFTISLNLLPIEYILGLIAVVTVLFLLMMGLQIPVQNKRYKKKVNRIVIAKVISVLLSILMFFGTLLLTKGNNLLSKITGANEQTHTISVIVLNESKYKRLEDLKGCQFGFKRDIYQSSLEKGVADIESKISKINMSEEDSFESLSNVLYNKGVDAIIIDEAYRSMLEAIRENFSSETRVVHSVSFKEKIEDIASRVDVTNESFNIYVSGIDTSGDVSTVSRSDANVIITVNPKTRDILMTSIPRDYYVTLASKGAKDKLTHSGNYGIQETVKTVENLMNIKINYYARLNFNSVIRVVNALGGITVNSPVAFTSVAGYSYVAGDNKLNGDETLAFVRERYNLASGDFDRGKNQARALTGIINKIMSPTVMSNYTNILESVGDTVETNMNRKEMTSFMQLLMKDRSSWDIKSTQVVGTGVMQYGGYAMPNSRLYYMIPDQDSVNKVTQEIKSVMSAS